MTPEEWASRIMAAWQKASSEDELDLETRIARALTQARAEALQEAIAAAESEPEPDDDVPDLTHYSKEELVRGAVRSTKKYIIERLRALPGAQP